MPCGLAAALTDSGVATSICALEAPSRSVALVTQVSSAVFPPEPTVNPGIAPRTLSLLVHSYITGFTSSDLLKALASGSCDELQMSKHNVPRQRLCC